MILTTIAVFRRCVILSMAAPLFLVTARAQGAEGNPDASGRFSVSAAAIVGLGIFHGSSLGPWLEPNLEATYQALPYFYLRGGVGFVFSVHSETKELEYHSWSVIESNVDDRSLSALLLRPTIGLWIAPPFGFEIGGIVGPAWTRTMSTQCGADGIASLTYGVAGGPVLSLEQSSQWQLGLQGQAVLIPVQRCTNGAVNPLTGEHPWPHFYSEHDMDALAFAVLGRLGYRF